MSETKTVEFRTGGVAIGAVPEVAAKIVWHIVYEAGARKLGVTQLVLQRTSLQVTFQVPDDMAGVLREQWVRQTAASLNEAVQRAGKELGLGVGVDRGSQG